MPHDELDQRKRAATAVPIHEPLAARWSPRAFTDTPLEPTEIAALLEAARWAPSSMNEQPWRLLLAHRPDDAEGHARLFDLLLPGNQTWAGTAPLLGLVAVATAFAKNGKPNPTAEHDAGLAMSNVMTEVTVRGLHMHMMGGYDRDAARTSLGLPDGIKPVAMFAIGHRAPAATLPDDLAERENAARERKPLGEIAMGARWGDPLAGV